jgi:hypothetical protein
MFFNKRLPKAEVDPDEGLLRGQAALLKLVRYRFREIKSEFRRYHQSDAISIQSLIKPNVKSSISLN